MLLPDYLPGVVYAALSRIDPDVSKTGGPIQIESEAVNGPCSVVVLKKSESVAWAKEHAIAAVDAPKFVRGPSTPECEVVLVSRQSQNPRDFVASVGADRGLHAGSMRHRRDDPTGCTVSAGL